MGVSGAGAPLSLFCFCLGAGKLRITAQTQLQRGRGAWVGHIPQHDTNVHTHARAHTHSCPHTMVWNDKVLTGAMALTFTGLITGDFNQP